MVLLDRQRQIRQREQRPILRAISFVDVHCTSRGIEHRPLERRLGPLWRKLWSTNPLERLRLEVKRRSDVVGVFPDDASIDRLVTAVIVEQHDEWAVAERRYLSETSRLREADRAQLPASTRTLRRLAG